MAIDQAFADRVRIILDRDTVWEEKRMFGCLAFMVDGHMALAVHRLGGVMLRVDDPEGAELVAAGEAVPISMGQKTMEGWLRVPAEHLEDDAVLAEWVARGKADLEARYPT